MNGSAVDHVLPVIGQPEINQRLQKGIPYALLGPAQPANIDRIPLPIPLVHVAPGTAYLQHMEHAIEEASIISSRTRSATPLRRKQRPDQFPFRILQIPATRDCSTKSSLEPEPRGFGNPFRQNGSDPRGPKWIAV
jgi:hypothetical protein